MNLKNQSNLSFIDSPDDPQLTQLCESLAEMAGQLKQESDDPQNWPRQQLELIDRAGINRWFIPVELGGAGWTNQQILTGYLRLSAACLTTTFIITQRAAAYRRIVASENHALRDELLAGIVAGKTAATVGISHLTTSRRHVSKPALAATPINDGGYRLDGFSPWVTGGCGAETLVVGAELEDGRQILAAVQKNLPGIQIEPGLSLIALSASQTGAVKFNAVEIQQHHLLGGPVAEVLKSGSFSGSGGSQTSGLAIGLAGAAVEFLRNESEKRPDLVEQYESLRDQQLKARSQLFAAAAGDAGCSSESLRIVANSLVLRSTAAALVAAKGAGFVTGHPVGRWCREALFFLVWSCPQAVAQANMCQLVGSAD